MLWQIWLSGVLGLWLVVVVFFGFSSTLNRFFLVVTGVAIAFLSFWSASRLKSFFSPSDSEIRPKNGNSGREAPASGEQNQNQTP